MSFLSFVKSIFKKKGVESHHEMPKQGEGEKTTLQKSWLDQMKKVDHAIRRRGTVNCPGAFGKVKPLRMKLKKFRWDPEQGMYRFHKTT